MCQVPPHNFNDVIDMTIKVINNPNISLEEVASNIRPDFPTGGIIVNNSKLTEMYMKGTGSIKIRGEVVKDEKDSSIVITSVPFLTNTGLIVNDIQEAIKNNNITDITRIVDRSKNSGVSILLKIKKGTDLNIVENLLYKYTRLESTITTSLILTEGRSFKRYNILEIFQTWINYRKSTLKRIFNYRISNKRKRVHILEGLLMFLDKTEEGLKIIRNASDKNDAIEKLMKKIKLSQLQAEAVMDLPLYRLTKLSVSDLNDEKDKLESEVKDILNIVGHESKLNEYIIEELKESKKVFGRERRTVLSDIDTSISTEDLVEDTEHNVFITEKGYIKKLSKENKSRGKIYGTLSKDDHVISAVQARNKDTLLLFSDTGKVFCKKLFEIRDHKKDNVGDSISSYIESGEKIVSIVPLREKDDKELLFLSNNGDIKRTKLSQFKNIKSSGIIATKLSGDSKLLSVNLLNSEDDEILVCTKKCLCARFKTEEVPCRLRVAGGVLSINLEEGDEVISAIILDKNNINKYLAVVESNGSIKKFPLKSIPNTKRAVKGRLISKKKENVDISTIFVIEPELETLNIITDKNSYKVEVSKIPEKLRTMDGKILVNIKKNEIIHDIIVE